MAYPAYVRRNERITGFVDAIWEWYAVHKRKLPWRDLVIQDTAARAYRILVSEVMLQQTQVDRVKVLYSRYLKRFPTLASLARASNRDVILAWRGMGYNSRALRLRDAARTIIERNVGIFPTEMEALQGIKGIGHYTAAAIRNFAFNLPTPCVDTNIRRILHRAFVGPERADGSFRVGDRQLLKLAADVLGVALDGQKNHDACNWHAALMDFGSLVQTKRNPKWDECPLTAKGLMKATIRNFPKSAVRPVPRSLGGGGSPKSEPGREIAGRFVPNRIIRGRIVEALRDEPAGLSLDDLGRQIAADWSQVRHRQWLQSILARLQSETLIAERAHKFILWD